MWLRRKTDAIGVLITSLLLASAAGGAAACGVETDCRLGDRTCRIALPAGHDKAESSGAVIFLHGFRGTAAGVMKNRDLTSIASEFGFAFVAAQAAGPEWNIPNIPSADAREGIDELAYFDALVDDLATRFNVARSRMVVAGFSSGAMTTWHLACYRGDKFAGFIPMSGTFWQPMPESCPTGPVNLIHFHGRDDPIVPLEGRPIKDAHQGDVFRAIALIRQLAAYQPKEVEKAPGLDCSGWTDNSDHILALCLFDGKHSLKGEHLRHALKLLLNR